MSDCSSSSSGCDGEDPCLPQQNHRIQCSVHPCRQQLRPARYVTRHTAGAPGRLDVPLGCEVLEGSRAILAGHVLVEVVLQGGQTGAVCWAGAELGDIEAGGVRHVDDEGIR